MAKQAPIARTVHELRSTIAKWRENGDTVALVPTMGSVHGGHLSLIDVAKKHASRVVASVFVNPTQFGPREDFKRYPRDEKGDAEKLAAARTDLVYAPSIEEMYPKGSNTSVKVVNLSDDLCGGARPQHFEGVATIVTKLLMQAAPDIAVFGEKDYQQLIVIKSLVRDLFIPVEIVGAPIVREPDGLAMSSRNVYLSAEERQRAPELFGIVSKVASDLADGRGCDDASGSARFKLEATGFRVDYVAVRDAATLDPLSGPVKVPARVLAAVYLGATRLIDNVAVRPKNKGK
ncbi:MAG TPA: pantoate--beta-alanine ligase [Methyloceanibacter sp.]|jgi:pantoate--beta-alanine ligase